MMEDTRMVLIYLREDGDLRFASSLVPQFWMTEKRMTDSEICEAVFTLLNAPLESLTSMERSFADEWHKLERSFSVGDAVVIEDGAHRHGYECAQWGWTDLDEIDTEAVQA